MSNLIKSSDIFEGDIFKIVVDSADLAKTKIAELNKELVKVGTSFKEELNGIKIIRYEESVYFANVENFKYKIMSH